MDGLVAGVVAGTVSTVTTHPLDIVKVRLQLGKSRTLLSALDELCRGPIRGVYRGLAPNLIGNAAGWGAYFWLYESIQRVAFGSPLYWPRNSGTYLVCSFTAGILSQFATNPIWVLKTRILGTRPGDPGSSASICDNAVQIWRQQGIRGFWRGFVPGTFGTVQSALYFALYAPLKPYLQHEFHLSDTSTYFAASGVAKSVAATVMYPHQVIRSRTQYSDVGMWRAIVNVWHEERWIGFYRGLSANLARVVPAMAITLVTYEHTKNQVQVLRGLDAAQELE